MLEVGIKLPMASDLAEFGNTGVDDLDVSAYQAPSMIGIIALCAKSLYLAVGVFYR